MIRFLFNFFHQNMSIRIKSTIYRCVIGAQYRCVIHEQKFLSKALIFWTNLDSIEIVFHSLGKIPLKKFLVELVAFAKTSTSVHALVHILSVHIHAY